MSVFSMLPDKVRDKKFVASRSPLNWRVELWINNGVFKKSFYARSEHRAEKKANRWLDKHYDSGGYRYKGVR